MNNHRKNAYPHKKAIMKRRRINMIGIHAKKE